MAPVEASAVDSVARDPVMDCLQSEYLEQNMSWMSLLSIGFLSAILAFVAALFAVRKGIPIARRLRNRIIVTDEAKLALEENNKQRVQRISFLITRNDAATIDNVLHTLEGKRKSLFEPFVWDRNDRTGGPLCLAARLGRTACVDVLLRHHAPVSAADASGRTALHISATNGRHDIVKNVLAYGADPNGIQNSGWSPLHLAALNGRTEAAEILIKAGAEIDKQSEDGRTPLFCSTQNGHKAMIELFARLGADCKTTDKQGNSAMHMAARNGSVVCLQVLLDMGLDIHQRNFAGESPLQLAAFRGHCEFVMELVTMHVERHIIDLVDVAVKAGVLAENLWEGDRMKNLCNVMRHVGRIPDFLVEMVRNIFDIISQTGGEILRGEDESPEDGSPSTATLHLRGAEALALNLIHSCMKDNVLSQELLQSLLCTLDELWTDLKATLESISKSLTPSSPSPSVDGKRRAILVDASSRVAPLVATFYRLHSALGNGQGAMSSDEKGKDLWNVLSKHTVTFREMVRADKTLLTSHFDFALENAWRPDWVLRDVVLCLDFDERRDWFYSKLENIKKQYANDRTTISVDRQSVVQDSCGIVNSSAAHGKDDALKGTLSVRFYGEAATGSGVRREWFQLMARELFNVDNALFSRDPKGRYQPNLRSDVNPDHLSYFRFCGRILGLALYHKELIDVSFTPSFLKHLCDIPISYHDFEDTDPQYLSSLQWILDNDITGLELSFSVESDIFGQLQVLDLKPDGRSLAVTNENKGEYVQLVTDLKLHRSIQQQIDSFREGLFSIVPRSLIGVFNERELQLLVSGIPEWDVDDWRKYTVYTNYEADDDVIGWFWECVDALTSVQKAQLLMFATGCCRVPIGGFNQLRGFSGSCPFTIIRSNDIGLPTSSTCFNLLKLPDYSNKEQLRKNLILAISYGCEGFSFS